MQKLIEKQFPLGPIQIEGTSDYAKNVSLASMGHLSWVLDHLMAGDQQQSVYLDIGANIGLTALLMDQYLKGATIHAFEPHPATFSQLERNVVRNRTGANDIQCHAYGLGEVDGQLTFRDVDQFNTGNSVLLEGSLAARAQKTTKVDVKKLDEMGLSRVDLMKIDVEVFELSVFRGAEKTLACTRVVLMEFNHWCLTALARVFPQDALETVCGMFDGVFVYDASQKRYVRIVTDRERWNFMHNNMVKANVNDLLLTNDRDVIDLVLRTC